MRRRARPHHDTIERKALSRDFAAVSIAQGADKKTPDDEGVIALSNETHPPHILAYLAVVTWPCQQHSVA